MNLTDLRNRIKRISVITGLCLICGCTAGCGDEIPEMTEEQEEIIADYSAALLLKFDSRSPSRLLPAGTVEHIDYVDPGMGSPEEIQPGDEAPDIDVDSTPEYSSDDVTVNDAVTGTTTGSSAEAQHPEGFSGFLEGTGLDVSYAGFYEVLDSYPSGEDANPFLSVEASEGNKLLVMHFNLTNVSAEDTAVNLGRYGLRYRVSLNGGGNKYIMTTLLSNDLMSYVGELPAGASEDLVAVCEISGEEADSIGSIDFTIKGQDYSTVIALQ